MIKEECDKTGVIETPAVLSTLLKLWTATKDEEKALKVLKNLQIQYPSFKVDAYKIIDLATLLITKDRFEDANALIDSLVPCRDENISFMSKNVWQLLNAASEYGAKHDKTENIAKRFLEILNGKGYCELSNTILGTIIKEYLHKKEIDEAIKTFEKYVMEYKKTPQTLGILTFLIESSDNEDTLKMLNISKDQSIAYIQQVVDLIKTAHGSRKANVNVILAFACTGEEQVVRKILMDPNVEFDSNTLLKSIEYLKNRSKIDVVVILARSGRNLNHPCLNEEKLYEFLLNDFVKTNDHESAIRLYEEIRKSDTSVVSTFFLKTLVKLLKKNNQKLPHLFFSIRK